MKVNWYSKIIRVVLAVVMVFIGLPLNVHIEQGRVRIGMDEAYADGEAAYRKASKESPSGDPTGQAIVVDNTGGGALTDYQVHPVKSASGGISPKVKLFNRVKVTDPIYDGAGLGGCSAGRISCYVC